MVVANNSVDQTDLSAISGHQKPAGSVIFPKVGGAIHTDKKRLLARPSLIDNNLMAVWPIDEDVCRSAFLFVYFQSVRLSSLANPGPLPSINNARLYELEVPVPPIGEQEKIVAVLGKLQRAIATQDALTLATRELKQAAMHRLFTHGIRRSGGQETVIGMLPANWELATIGEVAHVRSGGTPSRAEPANWSGGTIPWVKTGEIDYARIEDTEEKITTLGLENSAARLLPAGTLLLAMYGQGVTRGKVAILAIEAATNQACAAIVPKDARVRTDFLYYVLTHSYERLRSLAHGGQQQNLNTDLIRGFTFGLPTDESEQRDIVDTLATIDRKLVHHQRKRAALGDLFETMLHKLMTAQIRVADLDIDTSEVATSTEGGEHK